MTKATYRDARLVLQLMQLHTALGLSEALNWLWSDQFIPDHAEFIKKYPLGSKGNIDTMKICGYFETIGTLWKHGLINENLLFDWLAVDMVWDRIKGFALGVRQEANEPRLHENFEAMAKAATSWSAKSAKSGTRK